MRHLKKPDVAGLFYPDHEVELNQLLDQFLDSSIEDGPIPRAIIAPHAGYIYSGEIAGSSYKILKSLKGKIKNIILMGPAHRWPLVGVACHSATHFLTPLGLLEVNQTIRDNLINNFSDVNFCDQAFVMEHGLEVQLPFINKVFGNDIRIVPLIVGDISTQGASEIFAKLWNDPSNFFIVSSDLSHFHDYKTAVELDQKTSRIIENLDFECLNPNFACGFYSLRGLLHHSKQEGLKVKTLDLRNSGDTAGDKSQVVGYGAYAFY